VGSDFYEALVSVNGTDLWLMLHFLDPGETPEEYSTERLAAAVQKGSGLPDVPVEVRGRAV
jgi:hypothetical protein